MKRNEEEKSKQFQEEAAEVAAAANSCRKKKVRFKAGTRFGEQRRKELPAQLK